MELETLISECTAYDFKLNLDEKKPKSWLKSVSAFANGLGGSLFFGIDNDGIVKGLDEVQHVCEVISNKIRDYMDPLPEVEMIPHEDMDGLRILQLKVNAGHYSVGDNVGDVSDAKLTERQRNILNLIKESPTISGRHKDPLGEAKYNFKLKDNMVMPVC